MFKICGLIPMCALFLFLFISNCFGFSSGIYKWKSKSVLLSEHVLRKEFCCCFYPVFMFASKIHI